MKLSCAIIDDEPLAVELMESYVRKTPFLELQGSFGSGVAAFGMLRDRPVDLLFCDIQMPGLNGVEFSRMLPADDLRSIFVKTEYRLRQIELERILYIEGLKDYVKIHVEEETHPVLTLTSLKSLEEQLPADRFVRVHRSFIVQPSKIRSIERNRIVFGKEYIPVSENYRQAFFDFLAEHSLLF